ncbi:MAG: restriction endonuclease subunit S [Betaproteobacteria bacterium]|nr:restriction endonuclease subunit S [Betaproteobacteria bacterium]
MRSDWRQSNLGEFVRLQRGHDLTSLEQRPGNVPVMGSAGPNGTHDVARATGPGVVIGRSGASIGRVHFSSSDYWPHNTCLYVTDFCGNNPRFAYYLLSTLDLAKYNSGSAQPSLNRNFIYSMPVEIPGRREQDEIVEVLQTIDDRIDLLRQTNATLEAIAQALFKSWFVDFDPVRAKAEGRVPEGMDAETAALFPSEFEESELGAIPKGWSVRPFSHTVDIIGGGTPKTSIPDYWGGEIPWFSVVDAPAAGQVFALVTEKTITQSGLYNSSTKILPKWTTIISARGTVGKLALTGAEMAMNQSCYGLKSKVGRGETVTYLAAQRLVDRLKHLAHGGVFDTITRDTLGSVDVCDPPSEVINLFDSLTHTFFERILANAMELRLLIDLRDSLLPRLISGRLHVTAAMESVEDALK